ncbi:hypothetical protein [Nocardiopsis alba]|uniref:hypothetical protein n=1 Tax=Nocardiopsis alba TaxID=53437 RepID=UPI0035DBC547
MKNKRTILLASLLLIVAISFLGAYIRYSGEEEIKDAEPQKLPPTSLWVSNTVNAQTLSEVLKRDEDGSSIQAIMDYSDKIKEGGENRGNPKPFDMMEILLESEIIIESEGQYQAEIDMRKWKTGFGEEYSGADARQALKDALTISVVDWCGNPTPANDFADLYLDLHEDSQATEAEHLENIEEYVQCRSGN